MAASATTRKRIQVFLSSVEQEDRELRDELEECLSPLSRSGKISIWHDGKIDGGKSRKQEIAEHIHTADLILLLVSHASIASDTCYEQMEMAVQKQRVDGTKVISILLRPVVNWENLPVGQLQTLPINRRPITIWGNRQTAWSEVASTLSSFIFPELDIHDNQRIAYRNVISQPASLHPKTILKRIKVVKEIYKHLTQQEISALFLTGIGGIGKSVLANQLFRYASEQQKAAKGPFRGELLWCEIDATVSVADVVCSLSQALTHTLPDISIFSASDLAAEFFTLLQNADPPRLLVLDQFETWLDPETGLVRQEYFEIAEWLDKMNSYACASRVLLTSRFIPRGTRQPLGAYVQKYEVKELDESEGLQLLLMGGTRSRNDEMRLAVKHYHGHTMALTILRNFLHDNPGIRIAELFNDPLYRYQWTDEMGSLLNTIYRQLTSEQRELLFAFAVYREAVPLPAALAITGSTSSKNWPAALRTLLDQQLLQRSGTPARYRLHPIVMDFVRDNRVQGNQEEQYRAHRRAANYYKDLSTDATSMERQRPSREDAHTLAEAAWHLCKGGQKQEAYHLIQENRIFFDLHRWGNNSILLELYKQLMPLHDWQPEMAASIALETGDIYDKLGLKKEAQRLYSLALQYFRTAQQNEGVVKTLNRLGATCRALEERQQAWDYYQEALRICNTSTEEIKEYGETLNNLGFFFYEAANLEKDMELAQSQYRQALVYYEQALALHRKYGLLQEEATTLDNLGDVYASLEQSDLAYEHYWQALRCFQQYGDRRGEGIARNNLGVLCRECGREIEARQYYEQALGIFKAIGDRWQESKTLRNLGRWYFDQQNLSAGERNTRCLACFLLAKDLSDEVHKPSQEPIPHWIEETLKEELGTQQFVVLLKEVKPKAAQIIAQALQDV